MIRKKRGERFDLSHKIKHKPVSAEIS